MRLIDETVTPVHRTDDPKFAGSHVAPAQPGYSWVVSIVRASLLDAKALAIKATSFDFEHGLQWNQQELDKYALEPLGTTIEAMYPGALAYLEAPKNKS